MDHWMKVLLITLKNRMPVKSAIVVHGTRVTSKYGSNNNRWAKNDSL